MTTSKITLTAVDSTGGAFSSLMGRLNSAGSVGNAFGDKMRGIFGAEQVNRFGAALGGLQGKLAALGLVGGAGLAVGGLVAVKSAFDSVVDTAEKADRIDDLGGRLGLDAEQFQVLEKIAKDGGASIEEIGGAFMKFRINLQKAQTEGGADLEKMQKALGGFGLSMEQAQKMKPLELMKLMGQVSAASGTDADAELKLALFREAFGKTGATLVSVFEGVGEDYDKVLANMRKAGVLMTDEMAQQGGKAFKSWEKAQGAMKGLKMAFGIEMLPVFDQFAQAYEKKMKSNRDALLPGVRELAKTLSGEAEPFINDMDEMAKKATGFAKALSGLASVVGWDTIVLGGLALIAAPFVVSAMTVTGAIWGMGAAALKFTVLPLLTGLASTATALQGIGFSARAAWFAVLGPVAVVGVAVAGLAYLIYSNWGGIKAFLGGVWDGFTAGIAPVKQALTPISDVFASVFGVISRLFSGFFGETKQGENSFLAWADAGKVAGDAIAAVFKALLTPITLVLDTIKLVGAAFDFVRGKGFNFSSTTAKIWETPDAKTQPSAIASQGALRNFETQGISPLIGSQSMNGKLDVRITSDGRAVIDRVQSDSRAFEIDARSGGMFAA
jgi:hypothetical protein